MHAPEMKKYGNLPTFSIRGTKETEKKEERDCLIIDEDMENVMFF